jgi:hypothetical protein
LLDRRTRLIDDIGKPTEESEAALYDHIRDTLKEYPYDVPMAIVYRVDDAKTSDGTTTLKLEHTIGVRTNHVAAPPHLELTKSTGGFGPALREGRDTMAEWVALDTKDDLFPREVVEGIQCKSISNCEGEGEDERG